MRSVRDNANGKMTDEKFAAYNLVVISICIIINVNWMCNVQLQARLCIYTVCTPVDGKRYEKVVLPR